MTTERLNTLIDVLVKLATPVGVVIMLYLQSQFVTRQEFVTASEKLDLRIQKVEEVLIRMEMRDEVDSLHSKQIADHEQRLRTLEKIP